MGVADGEIAIWRREARIVLSREEQLWQAWGGTAQRIPPYNRSRVRHARLPSWRRCRARLFPAARHCRPSSPRDTARWRRIDETTNRANRRIRHQAVLGRVEVRVIEMNGEVAIAADRVLPIPPLQILRSPQLVMTADRGSQIGKDFANAILIARQRPGKSASLCGRSPLPSGSTTQASIWKGERSRARRTAPRNMRHQMVGAPVKQVHCKEERSARNPITVIIQHERSMPGLRE